MSQASANMHQLAFAGHARNLRKKTIPQNSLQARKMCISRKPKCFQTASTTLKTLWATPHTESKIRDVYSLQLLLSSVSHNSEKFRACQEKLPCKMKTKIRFLFTWQRKTRNRAGEITYSSTSSFFFSKPCRAGNCLPPVAAHIFPRMGRWGFYPPPPNSAKSLKMEEVERRREQKMRLAHKPLPK